MIESIEIRNFQIHKKTKIDFVDGINIISGTSDNGKSSIIRAFRWALENRPQGYTFRRWGTPEKAITAVDVVVDGEVISRKRGNVKNEYVFDGTTFKALRSDVPDPIKEHLEILPFNIQMQNDKVFLFQDSDSNVAKLINDISGISVIDDILKESNRRLRELNSEEKLLKDLIKEKKAQKATYKSFVKMKKSVTGLKEKIEDVEEKREILEGIEEDLSSYRALKAKKKSLPDVSDIDGRIEYINDKRKVLAEKSNFVDYLEFFVDFMEKTERIDDEDLEYIQSVLSKIEKLHKKLKEKEEMVSSLDEDTEQILYLLSERKENKVKLKSLRDRMEEIKEECSVCPVCDKEW